MSRIVFDSLKELKKWTSEFIRVPRRYVAYRTEAMELILRPTVNPRDNDYVYFKAHSGEEHKEVYEFIESRGISIFHVKDYEWRIDTGIGIRTSTAED